MDNIAIGLSDIAIRLSEELVAVEKLINDTIFRLGLEPKIEFFQGTVSERIGALLDHLGKGINS